MQAVRTKNVKQGGRNARKAKKKERKKERKLSRTVKQQQTLMFHGIPGRVNSCKKKKINAFQLLFVPSHFMNQVECFWELSACCTQNQGGEEEEEEEEEEAEEVVNF